MDKRDLELLRKFLPNQKWRLNNLYRIINEDGEDVLFQMRYAQEKLYDEIHYRNIILKARQMGFTTFIDILGLDCALFTPDYTFSVSAETKDKAADIFNKKIVYPYEHLPQEIRDYCRIVRFSKDGELLLGNGSTIQVMVSARSGTVRMLHVSEYGVVCAKQPGKAEEIQTGSIPAVPKSGVIFIESTAKGNAGQFYDMVCAAEAAQLSGRKLTSLDFKLHFFPWYENPEYCLTPDEAAGVVIPERLLKYFDQLYSLHGIELAEEQQAWYAVQEKTLHEKMWSEYPSYPKEAFKVAQDGAYYSRQFEVIYRDNRICVVPHEADLPVYTAWDLGVADETAIWFAQFYGKEMRLIDYYQASGEGLPHYAAVLDEKGYRYGGHFAPHDIAVRELGSGLSRLETARKLGIEFQRIPTNVDLQGGINHCRELLPHCWFDEAKTEEGRKCLENYKKDWDDKAGCYKSYPCHDWTSHGADAFRTLAQAWKMGRIHSGSGGNLASGHAVRQGLVIKGGLRK